MSDATLELRDVTTLTNIALLFAFESLKQMSETALQQGHAKASQLYIDKWREVEAEVKRRKLQEPYSRLKALEMHLQLPQRMTN